MDTLAPFAIVIGVSLAIFGFTHLRESYEAPVSIEEARKEIARSYGAVGITLATFYFFLDGFRLSERVFATVSGMLIAAAISFAIDVYLVKRSSRRQKVSDIDD